MAFRNVPPPAVLTHPVAFNEIARPEDMNMS